MTTPGVGYVPGFCSPWWTTAFPVVFVPVDNVVGERSSTDFGTRAARIAITSAATSAEPSRGRARRCRVGDASLHAERVAPSFRDAPSLRAFFSNDQHFLFGDSTHRSLGAYFRTKEVTAGGESLELHHVATHRALAVECDFGCAKDAVAVGFEPQQPVPRVGLHVHRHREIGRFDEILAEREDLDNAVGAGCCHRRGKTRQDEGKDRGDERAR